LLTIFHYSKNSEGKILPAAKIPCNLIWIKNYFLSLKVRKGGKFDGFKLIGFGANCKKELREKFDQFR